MKVTLLHPSQFKLDGGAMFGIIPKPLWEKKIKADDLNRIDMSLRVVLIQKGEKNILIDTGIGDYHPEKFNEQFAVTNNNSPLVSILDKQGLKPNDITDIILTHLHFDHVGGLGSGKNGTEILFPNATIHVHHKHYEYSQKATLRDSGSFHTKTFLPILDFYNKSGQLNLLRPEVGEIIPGINFRTSFGHTPYMIHPIFNNYIYMADLVPMSHHIRLPWVMGYDIEPGVTTVFKQKFYDDIIKNDLTMIFEHDIEVWGGKLGINERGQFYLREKNQSSKEHAEVL